MKHEKIIPIINLSNTSKMPCPSFSLPAQACKVGSKLAQIPGSVCDGCYAWKGFYNMPTVKAPRMSNLESLPPEGDIMGWANWENAMIETIKASKASKVGYFRWHDSGDLQSMDHLIALIMIASKLPEIKFWLPTKEKALVKRAAKSISNTPNLTVRLSGAMVDGAAPDVSEGIQTSTVHKMGEAQGFTCSAPSNGGKCGSCRACWDKSIANVSYAYH